MARSIDSSQPAHDPDPTLLDQLTEHVAHEIAAMEAAADLYQKTNIWIALEDFLLHTRILAEFFWPGESARSHPESAVLAEHYHKPWRNSSGGPPAIIRSTKDAIDKQLAHIARARVAAPQDLAQHLPALQTAIWDAWKRFLIQLGSDSYASKFKAHLTSRAAKLGITPPAGAT
jgi:hypothetical protein